jgi:glycosyltransferase
MKKILYIATVAKNRNRLDGETIKNKLLFDFLTNIDGLKISLIDTDEWQKHIPKIIISVLFYYFWCDKIIISAADRGSNIIINFFAKIKTKKPIYYFIIGGSLANNIKSKKWKVEPYKKIKKVYTESEILKKELNKLSLTNVEKINNFRKVECFKNRYKENKVLSFVYFGRVIREKGIEQAIKLVHKLNSEKYECTLDIYGQCKKNYLEKISPLFGKKISYHGEIVPNNKTEYEILSKYDCFIFPTEYPGECLPGALIDAYIAGLAILASNWKYASEYILDTKNGYLYEYKNCEDLYEKAKLLFKTRKIQNFKRESKKLSKKYYIENVLNDFKRLLIE